MDVNLPVSLPVYREVREYGISFRQECAVLKCRTSAVHGYDAGDQHRACGDNAVYFPDLCDRDDRVVLRGVRGGGVYTELPV